MGRSKNVFDPDKEWIIMEYSKVLEKNLHHLLITYTKVFILREVAGFSTVEIATLMNTNSMNVNLRLSCVKTQIKNKLANQIFSASEFEYNLLDRDKMVKKVLYDINSINKIKI